MTKVKYTVSILMFIHFLLILFHYFPVTPIVSKPEGVTLYGITRHDGTIYTKFTSEFCASHPEVDNIYWLERTNVAAWRSAIVSGSIPVSLLFGATPSIFDTLAKENLLLSLQNSTLINYIQTNIEENMIRYNETGGILWPAASMSSYGFTVNHKNLELYGLPVPETWEDLASPEYFLGATQHAIGIGDAPETTSNTRIYQIILQKFGWEKGWEIITRIAGNAKIFEGGSGPTRDSVITGSQAVAITVDFYGYKAEAQNSDCEYIIPKNSSSIEASPIAIASSTPYQQYAEDFVQFVLSKEGQAIWLEAYINRLPILYESFEYSSYLGKDRTDLEIAFNKTLEASISSTFNFNGTEASSIYDIVTFYFQGALTRSSTQLYAAWDKLVDNFIGGDIGYNDFLSLSHEMSHPKITLDEAALLQIAYISDPNIRTSLVTEYSTYAKNNYNKLGNKIQNYKDFSISYPNYGETLKGVVIIEAFAKNKSIDHINVTINSTDEQIHLATISSNFDLMEVTWNTLNFENGEHRIIFTLVDTDNETQLRILLVNINNEPTMTSSESTTSSTSKETQVSLSSTSDLLTNSAGLITSLLALIVPSTFILLKRWQRGKFD